MAEVAAIALGGFLVVAGITHFTIPGYYLTLVPAWVPWPRRIVALTGAIEIVIGIAVFVPTTRAVGAWAAAALITGYMASHIDAAVHANRGERFLDRPLGVLARLIVNAGYIAWAVVVALMARPVT